MKNEKPTNFASKKWLRQDKLRFDAPTMDGRFGRVCSGRSAFGDYQ
jgi:hypothetical protein